MWLSDGAVAHLRAVTDAPDVGGTRYRIIEPIGSGGMGAVYLAHDDVLDRDVALKVLRAPELQPALASRMLAEAHILARLEHPGIVPVHDAGTLPDGRVYYAMKFVRGQRLDDVAIATMPITERLRIFRRICEPVALAHAHGVIHRDIKPANIMVGAFGEVFVMDWGAARSGNGAMQTASADAPLVREPAQTAHGTRLGTPGWMAPEQERGDLDRIGPATDVYGLGAILRFLLGGATPDPAMARATPRPLRAICDRAMVPNPALRYPGAAELAADIDRFLDGMPVLAYPEPPWERLARFYRKHRTAILLVLSYLIMRVLLIAFG